jgi:DNA polymerase III subunit delta
MPEINYRQLEQYINHSGPGDLFPVYLIFGESFLYEKAMEILLMKLLPDGNRSLCHESVDVDQGNIQEALDRVNTFSLLGSTKVISLCHSRIFYEKKNSDTMLEKAKAALSEDDLKKASGFFMEYLGINNLTLKDIQSNDPHKLLNLAETDGGDWIHTLAAYCLENDFSPTTGSPAAERLEKSLEKGFPSSNHLVITTDHVDKRRTLYTVIKAKGLCVDCSVPKGERKADKESQYAFLQEHVAEILNANGKKMDSRAVAELFEITGFDLHILSGNVEKLISYVGDRKHITEEDVNHLLSRTKIDPIFEITNAIAERNVEKSIYYVQTLMANDVHPLQILAALVNQMRRLLICRSIVPTLKQKGMTQGMSFPEFKRTLLPVIEDLDADLLNELVQWDNQLNPSENKSRNPGRKKAAKPKPGSDVIIAKNPNNPFPIFQLLVKADNFTLEELKSGMKALQEADKRLKTTNLHPKLVLEKALINLCGINEKKGAFH